MNCSHLYNTHNPLEFTSYNLRVWPILCHNYVLYIAVSTRQRRKQNENCIMKRLLTNTKHVEKQSIPDSHSTIQIACMQFLSIKFKFVSRSTKRCGLYSIYNIALLITHSAPHMHTMIFLTKEHKKSQILLINTIEIKLIYY